MNSSILQFIKSDEANTVDFQIDDKVFSISSQGSHPINRLITSYIEENVKNTSKHNTFF